ncbi:Pyr_redox_2 domain-containing protein [Azospirillaceae bacterium]
MSATSSSIAVGSGQPRHHVIIGSGVAGNQAAEILREREPDSRITIITASSLLFYNRYQLPNVFRGCHDWRAFLAYSPDYYRQKRIIVRRNSLVSCVDGVNRMIKFAHNESMRYDTLLVASGGRGYMPEDLMEFKPLMHGFGSFEQAMTVYRQLPEGGRVVMLGGDTIGLDLARTLIYTGYRVTLVANEHTFFPHQVVAEERPKFLSGLTAIGVDVVDGDKAGGVTALEKGARGLPARRVLFRDGSDLYGDIVLPFMGLVPAVEFMVGSGPDIERGLLVSPSLRTTDPSIFAAGDVCQIWSAEESAAIDSIMDTATCARWGFGGAT